MKLKINKNQKLTKGRLYEWFVVQGHTYMHVLKNKQINKNKKHIGMYEKRCLHNCTRISFRICCVIIDFEI